LNNLNLTRVIIIFLSDGENDLNTAVLDHILKVRFREKVGVIGRTPRGNTEKIIFIIVFVETTN